MTLKLDGQNLELLPERAVFWHERDALILSDVHLGKAQSYRSEGVTMPLESGLSDLERINRLAREFEPSEAYILGDFIHHRKSWTPEFTEELTAFFILNDQIEWHLILGNHERGSSPKLEELPITLTEGAADLKPFKLAHGHSETEGFTISGHIHPAVTLQTGPLKMRFPCFVLSRQGLLLPSFGEWTGGVEVERRSSERYFACAADEVFEVALESHDASQLET